LRVLVTGSTGFIGRHTVHDFAAAGDEVISTSRAPTGPSEAALHVTHDFASATEFPSVGKLDAIVHLAGNGNAQAAWWQASEITQINAQGTVHAIQLAAKHKAAFILASTQRVYQPATFPLPQTASSPLPPPVISPLPGGEGGGEGVPVPDALPEDAPTLPPDPYGYSKLAAELYVQMAGRLFGVRGAIFRMFSVYGPGQRIDAGESGVVAILGQRALEDKPLLVLSHQRKDFVDVADCVAAMRLALEKPSCPARTYNIATGVPTTVHQLAVAVKKVVKSSSDIVEDYSEGDPGSLVADITRARTELGYEPRISLEVGLRRYAEWLLSARADPA